MLAAFFALQGVSHAGVLTDHPGRWLGDLQTPNGPKLKIGAELFLRADGSPWMSLAVPDQGAYDIPAKGMRDADGTLDIDLPRLKLKLTWASDHFDAQFQEEGGPTLAFELRQVERFPMPVRPQTPKGRFPYRNLELAIPSQPGVPLGATLSIPRGGDPPQRGGAGAWQRAQHTR